MTELFLPALKRISEIGEISIRNSSFILLQFEEVNVLDYLSQHKLLLVLVGDTFLKILNEDICQTTSQLLLPYLESLRGPHPSLP